MSILSMAQNLTGRRANIWYAAKLRDDNWVIVRAEFIAGKASPIWHLICDKGNFYIHGLLQGNDLEKQIASGSLNLGTIDELKHVFIGKQIWFDRNDSKKITSGTQLHTDLVMKLVALT